MCVSPFQVAGFVFMLDVIGLKPLRQRRKQEAEALGRHAPGPYSLPLDATCFANDEDVNQIDFIRNIFVRVLSI